MSTPLITSLRESSGYLQDEGWHQTAQLMVLASQEIERLDARTRELEDYLRTFDEASAVRTPEASNQNSERVAVVSSRR